MVHDTNSIQTLLDVIIAFVTTHFSLHGIISGLKYFKTKKDEKTELAQKQKQMEEQEQQRKMLELIKQNTSNKGS